MPARLGDRFAAGFDNGAVGWSKRELGDNHIRQGLALNIDALPKAIDAEDDGAWRLAKALEHLAGRQAVRLCQEFKTLVGEPAAQALGAVLKRAVAREQHEGPAACTSAV